ETTPTENEFYRETIQTRCQREIPVEEFYENASSRGIDFGPSLRSVGKLWIGDNEALAFLQLPADLASETNTYKLHPSLLDAAFQVAVAAATPLVSDLFIPVGCESLHVHKSGIANAWTHARVRQRGSASNDTHTIDVSVYDDAGHSVVEVTGFHIKRVRTS